MSDPLAPPPDDAPVLQWALWYLRTRLGIPLPVRAPAEADAAARWAFNAWAQDNPAAAADERAAQWDAILARYAKQPLVEWRAGMWVRDPPDETQLVQWFGAHPDRRVFLLCGPGTGLCVLDVDTYKGGDPSPWIDRATVVARTPSGGLQLWYAEAEVGTDTAKLAPGVDRRGRGGGVAAPCGRASPGRAFERFALPLAPFPAAAIGGRDRQPLPADGSLPAVFTVAAPATGPSSSMAAALRGPVPDGHRTEAAKEIVGVLCRPRPVPPDAAAEALRLLADDGQVPAGLSLSGSLWRAALDSAQPRPEELVVALVDAWARLRCSPPWRPSNGQPAAQVAASLWRTSIAAETERAALPPAPALPPAAEGPPLAGAAPDDPTLRRWAPREADRYGLARFRERRAVGRIPVARLPPWVPRGAGGHELSPWGHGWGPWLDRAIGGLRPGRLIIIGARKAKAGKTAFVHQLASGLAMLSAEREALPGSTAPLLLVVWVTEMDLDDLPERGLARHLGLSQSVFQSPDEHPGDNDLVERYLAMEAAGAGDLHSRARQRFVRLVELGDLMRGIPEENVPGRKDGPEMMASVEAIVEGAARQLEAETGRAVWRVVVVDPYQRRTEEGEDTTAAETALGKLLRTLTDRHKWITICTSDSTKASATEEIEPGLPPDVVVARVMRGSYAVTHHACVTMAIDVELSAAPDGDERRANVYVGVTRGAPGCDRPLPFRYWRSLGRFVPVDPCPPPPVPPATTPSDGADGGSLPDDAAYVAGPAPAGRGAHLRGHGGRMGGRRKSRAGAPDDNSPGGP